MTKNEEPTVQVPVSRPTRAQIADRLIERLRNSGGWPVDEVWQRWQNLFTEYDRDIALFSQPSPSAGSPVRMTQGMAFTAHPNARRYIYRGGGTYRDESTGAHVSASAFDPSTIRDVTPPKEPTA